MFYYSHSSIAKLQTCATLLYDFFSGILPWYDHSILYGHRSAEEQFALFQQGRSLVDGHWVITDRTKIVTNCDGYIKLSKHNFSPSLGIDVAPCLNGKLVFEERQVYHFAGFVRCRILSLGLDKIIVSGADWNSNNDVRDQTFNDLLHWEIASDKP